MSRRAGFAAGGAVLIASAVTLYFFRQNLLGIHESSDKALKIMIATTVMAVVMLGWCRVTLAVQGPHNAVPVDARPDAQDELSPWAMRKSPLGFLGGNFVAAMPWPALHGGAVAQPARRDRSVLSPSAIRSWR